MQDALLSNLCPCGSGQPYHECCEPLHRGQAAASPEALMRSRFTAFVLWLPDYLKATWHPSARPGELSLESSPEWTTLEIKSSHQSGDNGSVHFRAIHRMASEWGFLEENSAFVREQGCWYYLSGDTREGLLRPGRNDRCPCGSGKKHKACCL